MEDSDQSSGAALGMPPSVLAKITGPGQTSRVNLNLSLSKSTGMHTKHGLKDLGRRKNFSFNRC